ncbi:Uma2 family endonuclease [Streptomyces sp. NPDC046887]|uniref:Uma2 family endonuclease n=1 Tax=Streptomyces sp. NPDC046887 TaxID=3155472 RepID=UPI0033DDB08C
MTPGTAKRPQLTTEEFEQLARQAPETVTLELVKGKLKVKPVPDGDHGEIIMWLQEQCMQHKPGFGLYGDQGLVVESYRAGRARPDGSLAQRGYFAGRGEWSDPSGVLMAVEVTSYDSDTDRRDRKEKAAGYAAAGIPVYLLVDRDGGALLVHSEPHNGEYRQRTTYAYGDTVALPDPVGITLDTEKLKEFAG